MADLTPYKNHVYARRISRKHLRPASNKAKIPTVDPPKIEKTDFEKTENQDNPTQLMFLADSENNKPKGILNL